MRTSAILVKALTALLAGGAALAQGPCVLRVDGAPAGFRLAGGPAAFSADGPCTYAELPAGHWQLCFPPGGGGRPAPVAVEAPPDGLVVVAVDTPPPGAAPPVELGTGLAGTHLFGDGADTDVRVRVRVRLPAAAACGLACRWSGPDDHYRFVWDAAAAALRLERHLGGTTLLLARAEAPAADDGWHDLELQVEGFRLQAFFDDCPVAEVMDGALAAGRFGTWVADGASAEFEGLTAAPPAVPLATVATVSSRGRAEVFARSPVAPGSVYALCLRLDRPAAAWPTDGRGFEIFVLQRPAEPLVGPPFAAGRVGTRGEVAGWFAWPDGPALANQAALVGGFLGTPDGQALQGRLPWAAVRF